MGLQRVSQTSVALLRAGEEFDQCSSLQGISLHLLLQSSHGAIFFAGDHPGLSNTVVDDGNFGKSDEQIFNLVIEPGASGELMLSLGWTSEMKSTVSTVGVGGEGDQGVVIAVHLGLLFLLFLFNVVGT